MTRQWIVALFLIIVSGAFLSGCYYDKAEQVYPPQTVCDTTNVKYSVDIVSILSANCYACHSGSASAGGNIRLDSYALLMNQVANGKLVKSVSHSAGASAMPKNQPKMPACNVNRIVAWVNKGAPNN